MRYAFSGLAIVAWVAVWGSAIAAPGEKGHTHATFNAGEPGNPKKPFRIIEIIANEGDGKMLFTPERIEVKRGEQIKFIIRNDGALPHDLMLDSFEANKKHAIAM